MSFLTYRTIPTLRSALTAAPTTRIAGARSLSVSTSRAAFSEAEVNHEDRSGEIDKHKKDSLDKQQSGNPEWKKELASQSEAALKADKNESGSIKDMQKQGEELGKKQQ